MSGQVKDAEIRAVVAALPHSNTRTSSVQELAHKTGMHPARLVKVLLCMRTKGIAWHTPTKAPHRRRWRMA